jgi:hypothetical protein
MVGLTNGQEKWKPKWKRNGKNGNGMEKNDN